MTMTDEAVRALLDGTTPGPWTADETDPSDVVVWASPDKAQNDELIANVGHRVQPVALAFDCDGPNARLMAAAPDLARALLQARAECDRAHMIIATERAKVVRLRAENARLRADAKAAVAMVVERAASAIRAEAKVSPYHNGMTVVFQRGLSDGFEAAAQIVAELAPVDGLAMAEAMRKERDDLRECLKGADDRNLKLGSKLQDANADLAAAQAQIEALRAITTHGADTIATVLILDIAAAMRDRDRVYLTRDETSLGPRILEFAAAAAALPVPNFSAGWPLEEGDGSIIVGATKPAKEGE